MPAFYANSLPAFLSDDPTKIVGRLTTAGANAHYHQQIHSQTKAWYPQLDALRKCFDQLAQSHDIADWGLLLEYPIPRRAKRIDAVIIARGVILVLEFKIGEQGTSRSAIAQVEDYCLDLRDFHKRSRDSVIVPVLISADPTRVPPLNSDTADHVKACWQSNLDELGATLSLVLQRYSGHAQHDFTFEEWDRSDYAPTPTIIEAAQALYSGQDVKEISRCHGGVENLTQTTDAVLAAVESARANNEKVICFITGVPGAGKTLAGLNVVHNRKLHDSHLGVFLSGNGPLVRVLTEALARDNTRRTKVTLAESRRKVATFIQNVHKFIDAYFAEPKNVPVDKVAVFDEAQRAWNAAQSKRKFDRAFSEPEIMLEIMDRHKDWAVIVALIGCGQEINSGEAGLSEWGRALAARFPHWRIVVSPELKTMHRDALFASVPSNVRIEDERSLHLRVGLRSYRAQVLADLVEAIIARDTTAATQLMRQMKDYPLVMTRSLSSAKRWLNHQQRGTRRTGLIASSGARRLRAHGLDVTADLDVENWFLNASDDVRSSFYLEVPATEFGIQGLELDWTAVCWGGDLCPAADDWICRKFSGTKWQSVRDPERRQYVINKYRVLLTRAREGLVIWVPPGDDTDATRPRHIYDRITNYLSECGIPSLDDRAPSSPTSRPSVTAVAVPTSKVP